MADNSIARLVAVAASVFLVASTLTTFSGVAFSQSAGKSVAKSVKQAAGSTGKQGKKVQSATDAKTGTKNSVGVKSKTASKKKVGAKGSASAKSKTGSKSESCGKPTRYKVADGDSLWKIANKYKTTVDALKRLNGRKANDLHPGRVLVVKAAKPCPKPAPTPVRADISPADADSSTGVVDSSTGVVDSSTGVVDSSPGLVGADHIGPPESVQSDRPPESAGSDPVPSSESAMSPALDPAAIRKELALAGAYDGIQEIGHDATPPDLVGVPPARPCDLDGFELGAPGEAEDDDDESGISEDYETGEMPVIELNEFGFVDDGAACADYLGQFTKMPENPKGSVNIYHTVKKGDTLGKIAKKYRTTVKNLQSINGLRNNPKKARRLMHPGKKVLIRIGDPKDLVAHRPFLKDWVKLSDGEGFSIKRPSTAYGRPWAINLMLRAFCELRRRFPETDNIVVGDWSGIVGGQLSRHLSHKTGRDVDLSYFARGRTGMKHFIKVNAKTMAVGPSWELVRALLDTRQVEYIFMDWTLQREMYEYALRQGFNRAELDRVFQYPEGRRVRTGIIRWSRGHDDHIHVRFRCPKDDSLCR